MPQLTYPEVQIISALAVLDDAKRRELTTKLIKKLYPYGLYFIRNILSIIGEYEINYKTLSEDLSQQKEFHEKFIPILNLELADCIKKGQSLFATLEADKANVVTLDLIEVTEQTIGEQKNDSTSGVKKISDLIISGVPITIIDKFYPNAAALTTAYLSNVLNEKSYPNAVVLITAYLSYVLNDYKKTHSKKQQAAAIKNCLEYIKKYSDPQNDILQFGKKLLDSDFEPYILAKAGYSNFEINRIINMHDLGIDDSNRLNRIIDGANKLIFSKIIPINDIQLIMEIILKHALTHLIYSYNQTVIYFLQSDRQVLKEAIGNVIKGKNHNYKKRLLFILGRLGLNLDDELLKSVGYSVEEIEKAKKIKDRDISQHGLGKRIIAYYKVMEKPLSQKEKEFVRRGLCHGWSVFFKARKLVLAYQGAIANWDEKKESLATLIRLSDGSEKTLSATIEECYQKVTQYQNEDNQALDGLCTNLNINKENISVFVDDGDRNKLICALRRIAKQSKSNQHAETDILLTSFKHACKLFFIKENGVWIFRDPNDKYGVEKFNKIDDLVDRLYQLSSEGISLTVIGCGDKLFDDLKSISPQLFSGHRLHLLAKWDPKFLESVLDHIDAATIDELAKALVRGGLHNWTGLHMIACYAPNVLPKLFKLAEHDENIRNAIPQALVEQDDDNWTGLHAIACNATNTLSGLFELAEHDENIRNAIAQALVKQAKENNWTGLRTIAGYAPNTLLALFELAKIPKNGKIRNAINQALVKQDKANNWTGLHMIVCNAPNTLSALFELAEHDEKIGNAIAEALVKQNKNNWTGLHAIACNAPNTLSALFELAKNHENIINALADALSKQTGKDSYYWTGLQSMAYHSPTSLLNLFEIMKVNHSSELVQAVGITLQNLLNLFKEAKISSELKDKLPTFFLNLFEVTKDSLNIKDTRQSWIEALKVIEGQEGGKAIADQIRRSGLQFFAGSSFKDSKAAHFKSSSSYYSDTELVIPTKIFGMSN